MSTPFYLPTGPGGSRRMSSSLGVVQVKGKPTKRARILGALEGSGDAISFAEIGRSLGLSRERVRQLARKAGSDAHKNGKLQEYACAQCGGPFTVWPSKIKRGRRFCSPECACRARGPRVPRLTFICEVCGETYTRKASKVKRGTRFCSKACHGKWLTNEFQQTRDERGRFRPMARERGRFNAIAVEKLLCGRTTVRA